MRSIALVVMIFWVSLASAQPRVVNGELRTSAPGTRLTLATLNAVSSTTPAWVGYAVATRDGDHRMCCWNSDTAECCQGCRLESGGTGTTVVSPPRTVVTLENARAMHVLFRIQASAVERIRIFSVDCTLDAGGLTLHWLGTAPSADSVALLATFLDATSPKRLADGAMTALAMHGDRSALERLVVTARSGGTSHLRGQALFWLSQRAGDEASRAITEAVANDPETDVKKRAVFALSQLPPDEGVPLLIQTARTHSNPAVRKQAMFWLGQSKDARALRFFEEILFK